MCTNMELAAMAADVTLLLRIAKDIPYFSILAAQIKHKSRSSFSKELYVRFFSLLSNNKNNDFIRSQFFSFLFLWPLCLPLSHLFSAHSKSNAISE